MAGWCTGIAAIFPHCFVDYPNQRAGAALLLFTLLAAADCSTAESPHEIRTLLRAE
jgi:hypothetical protein